MESRKGPKFRKKKKNKNDQKTLAERIMQKREEAALEAERNSNKSEGSSSLENGSEENPTPQTTPKDMSEAANTPGSDGHLSPSESVDISHITKDSDQKKRTPTPEPTLSASHSDQLLARGSAAGSPSQNTGSTTRPTDSKPETANDIQSSYQKPLQPAYAPYQSEDSIPNQSKSQQQSQHQIPQQQPSSGTSSQKQVGPQSGEGRDIPVTNKHIATSAASAALASSSSSSSSPSSSVPVKGTTIPHASSSSIPPSGNAGQEGQTQPLPPPQATNSNYNQYMSLAQKIVLQRQIVAACDSVTRQQPQQNAGSEANPESTEKNQASIVKENNQLPQTDIADMSLVTPAVPVSGQEPCALADKKCPIQSPTNSLEKSKDLNQQENLNEYKSDTTMRQTPHTVDNQTINILTNVPVTEPNKTDQSGKSNGVSENHCPEKSKNGFVGKSKNQTVSANEDLDLVDYSELEALEKMVDQDLQSLVSGTNSEESAPVINKDLKNKVLSKEFQRKIDRFLNDI